MSRAPITRHVVSTLPPSPARKPGNPSPRSYHGLGRRWRDDIRAIRVTYRPSCGTEVNPSEHHRAEQVLFLQDRPCRMLGYRPVGTVTPESLYCVAARRGTPPPCTLPPKTAMCIFYFFCFPAKILYIGKFDDLTHPGHKARHRFIYI